MSDARASQGTGGPGSSAAPRPGGVTALHLEVEPRIGALPGLRRAVAAWLASQGVSDDDLGSAQVVVSELTANAIEASGRDEVITVDLALGPGVVEVEVRNPSHRTTPVPIPPMAEPMAPRGRGLAIVGALARDLELSEVDGQTVARASLPRT